MSVNLGADYIIECCFSKGLTEKKEGRTSGYIAQGSPVQLFIIRFCYYRCVNTKKKRLCDKKPVKKDLIENRVIDAVMEMIQDDNIVRYIVDAALELQSRDNSNLPLLKQQRDETTRAINNMLNAIQQGILTTSTKQRLDELEETKSKLEVSILQEQMDKPLLTREQLTFWIYRFRSTDV